ncbi:hypothetical protein Tco_0926637, partial [Tanacetum coccineum]
ADRAQSSRVPVPLPEDPYEAIRQAYLVGTYTESENFEVHESPHTVAPPTLLPDSTLPKLVPVLCRTARMAVRVPPKISPGFSTSMAEIAAMSDSALRKRGRGDEESSDSDSGSEDVEDEGPTAEDEGPTAEDEDPAAGDEGLAVGDEGPGIGVESLSLGLGYEALRRQEIALGEGRMPSVFEIDPEDGIAYIDVLAYPPRAPPAQTPPSPEWSSGSLPISPTPSIVPSPISSP